MDRYSIIKLISTISFIGIAVTVVLSVFFKANVSSTINSLITFLLVVFLVTAGVSELLIRKIKK
ncbi:hypothetical protein SAMN05661096_00428 [Marivirga sericea]|uniref:Uncharacterized protein n=1 Tax=Marivirga sericea TaxID=1028 RepID=A0A1X7IAN7_9BACT|nr:hypothetical protein [Marivirga sericea]SMG11688.1 hypothetical protein SAMN05661096_00428 [Marivirga sericea]